MRLRIALASCRMLWTDLAKSSLMVRLKELSKIVLCVAGRRSSEVMPETQTKTAGGARSLCGECSIDRDGRGKLEEELAKCVYSEDCEGCRVAEFGDEVLRRHSKERRERIGVTRMCDDAGQQRLHTVEEQRAPAASAARSHVAQEGQASLAMGEVAQESRETKR